MTKENKKEYEIEERLQYSDYMSEIIKRAEREGDFDDLPGKGKPLNIRHTTGNSYEAQLNKTLRDNNILPRWVELANQIDDLKEKLAEVNGKERKKKIKEINKLVKEYNFACPPSLQRNKVSD
ncbi:DnaJ family domain-containing protein [Ornithinibacillus halophilus]|uniref:DnaJ homologue subfamily C member 28 conserved domain-containing protein n=1 Tax=Ornithinibacillus halophilus TaxID=930117 RepID=A0A1M5NV35_9BACI|nr:DUF1992 domain-containing protein [Ornithinibacillus halophilus]SHG92833.1 protein of unknown function [Ornithinibacillus halophilus]